jgi:multidrug efflux system membrane fusion protein
MASRFLIVLTALAAAGAAGWIAAGRPDVARLKTLAGLAPAAQDTAAPGGKAGQRQGGAPVAVVTAEATTADFPIKRRSIGYAEPMASVVVKSRIDSQLLEQHVRDGQMVKAGDLLFTLDDKEILAAIARDEATLARDRAQQTRADADLKRKRELLSSSAGSQQQVDQAVADSKAAAANVAADEAALQANQLRLSYTKIAAPISGRLGTIQLTPGNLVRSNDAGGGLVTVTQIQPLRVSFTLPERDLSTLRSELAAGHPPTVRVIDSRSGKVVATGAVSFIENAVDISSGTITVKAVMPNDDMALWPGQYADIEVDLDIRKGATIIPTVAVQAGQDSPYVYVATADKTAELRKVSVIATDGERTAIAKGLEPGERVVVDGQMRLSPGARIRETTPGVSDAGDVAKPAAARKGAGS